jgi:hypothetical protein
MGDSLLNKVYSNIIRLFQHHEATGDVSGPKRKRGAGRKKTCPVTGLDISMQPKNSKFLSYTGVRWYYNNDYDTYREMLAPLLRKRWKYKSLKDQFREIAHIVRNRDSNPRNNIRRVLARILSDKNTLFNNVLLIDKKKLKKAGLKDLS